ncbi:hypothetical protein H5410_051178 [Solanum commersonii]|uniref:Uncharacterized protein n=1 Tax=Solanum commersonii TaxID=4109 RepID=A0A9J5WYV0_SOLCO|nr:hypothetical protein H5410_051178 [Solanum commersonii]
MRMLTKHRSKLWKDQSPGQTTLLQEELCYAPPIPIERKSCLVILRLQHVRSLTPRAAAAAISRTDQCLTCIASLAAAKGLDVPLCYSSLWSKPGASLGWRGPPPIRETTKIGSPRLTGKTTKTQTARKREEGELDELTTPAGSLTHRLQAPACWQNEILEADSWKLAFPLDISQWLQGLSLALLLTSTAQNPYHWKETTRLAVNRINPLYSSLRHNCALAQYYREGLCKEKAYPSSKQAQVHAKRPSRSVQIQSPSKAYEIMQRIRAHPIDVQRAKTQVALAHDPRDPKLQYIISNLMDACRKMGFPAVMARIYEIMFFLLFVFFLNGATRGKAQLSTLPQKGATFFPLKMPVLPSGPSKKHNSVPKLRFIPAIVVYGSKHRVSFGTNPLHN